MIRIILDTNVLISKHKVDLFSEISRLCDFNYKIFILDKTIEELAGKSNSKLALALLKAKNVGIISTKKDKPVDDLLLDMAESDNNIMVVTQDIHLKRLLKEKGIKILTIRQNKYLIFVN